jgi:pimeloyl-ACP methyl ester carboxylesterase
MRLSLALLIVLALLAWAGVGLVEERAPVSLKSLAALALPLLCAVAIVVAGSLLASALDRAPERARGLARLRLWWDESLAFGWCFLIAQPLLAPFMRSVDPLRPGQQAQVLLVHGFLCNRGLWWFWRRRLAAAGFRCAVIDLAPSWWSMQRQLTDMRGALEALHRQAPELPLYIIGHSMGGLAARMQYARSMAGGPSSSAETASEPPLAGVVCIGAPHHGTILAGGFGMHEHGPPLPTSRWLVDFNRSRESSPVSQRLNLWSVDDAIVVPAASGQLDDADLRLKGHGHMGLCQSAQVVQIVIDWLRGPWAQGSGPCKEQV